MDDAAVAAGTGQMAAQRAARREIFGHGGGTGGGRRKADAKKKSLTPKVQDLKKQNKTKNVVASVDEFAFLPAGGG